MKMLTWGKKILKTIFIDGIFSMWFKKKYPNYDYIGKLAQASGFKYKELYTLFETTQLTLAQLGKVVNIALQSDISIDYGYAIFKGLCKGTPYSVYRDLTQQ